MNLPKVFLSYVKENEAIIRILDQFLIDYGIDVITNYKNIDGGSNWKRTLKQLIESSGYFIACFSKEFNMRKKSVAYRELNDAIECAKDFPFDHKWIIPIRINECIIPSIEIGSRGQLNELQRIDLFPGAKWYEGVESIVNAIDKDLITNPQEALASPQEIEILKRIGFNMGQYYCNELGDIKFNMRREYWSQSEWFRVTPETYLKLPNYITAIVAGTREGILSEIRLSLTINNHSDKDNAYDSLIEKCNQLCVELCGSGLSDEIIHDLIHIKNSFTNDKKFRPHSIYTDNDYRLEGININMHNEVSHKSLLDEKPIRFRFHITKISFTS
ncbi:MAG: toll/interleukin-1 receptor domain-containing protein [Candidatus Poribacteria bacterium]|nr:toll/interleukin-1 receptor domain-containing protein [Candidatus Poribacteria bacterium]